MTALVYTSGTAILAEAVGGVLTTDGETLAATIDAAIRAL